MSTPTTSALPNLRTLRPLLMLLLFFAVWSERAALQAMADATAATLVELAASCRAVER